MHIRLKAVNLYGEKDHAFFHNPALFITTAKRSIGAGLSEIICTAQPVMYKLIYRPV